MSLCFWLCILPMPAAVFSNCGTTCSYIALGTCRPPHYFFPQTGRTEIFIMSSAAATGSLMWLFGSSRVRTAGSALCGEEGLETMMEEARRDTSQRTDSMTDSSWMGKLYNKMAISDTLETTKHTHTPEDTHAAPWPLRYQVAEHRVDQSVQPAAGKSTKGFRLRCTRRTHRVAAKLHSNPAEHLSTFTMKDFRSPPQTKNLQRVRVGNQFQGLQSRAMVPSSGIKVAALDSWY